MGFGDLGKKYRLERSGIEYSAVKPFYEVIESIELTEDIIQDVLDIVEKEFDNHDGNNPAIIFDILNTIKKFPDSEKLFLRQIYYHLLRFSVLPKITDSRSLEVLNLAYRDINNNLDRRYPYISLSRLQALFLFGYYDNIKIDSSLTVDIDLFRQRLKVVGQCCRYTSVPGMLKKREQFSPFSDNETSERLYVLITKIPHNDEELDLLFWGYVFIVLLNTNTSTKIISYFEKLPDANHTKEKEIFKRFLALL